MQENKTKTIAWNSIKAEFLEGVTPKDLAIKYNVDARQIHNKAYNDGWTKEVKKIQENIREITQDKIKTLTNKALSRLEDVLSDTGASNSDIINATRVINDINGLKVSKQEVEQTNLNATPFKIEIIE
ncbi:hypothetical protein KBA27_06300 [bacterium]|nr:hypothetical protein [bacterium]